MNEKINLDKFCEFLNKTNMDFTDWILEEWESIEEGNTKLEGMTKDQWIKLYLQFLKDMKSNS